MKVQLEKSYPMPASADTAWALLQDIEGVASCMPGAKITEKVDEQHYKGTVAVKLGPANLSFRGEIEVKGIDTTARSLHLFAKGTDATGGSAASMDLKARAEAVDAASCNLMGTSEVTMSGKVATFGGRMMGPVSDQILGQFAANFAAKVQAMQAAAAPSAGGSGAPAATQATAAAAEPKPLNGLALLWAVIKGWFSSLFAAKKS
ncbi:MAG TPA: SRPBCC family protein [Burkholderiaceae bacterium]|nr:SRPBCC family protein [Burkholderiaceae bacterium]